MANITREIEVGTAPEAVWQRVRAVGEAHLLFAGVLTACELQGGERTVTFANGMVLKELIVDVDDARRRVAYAATGGRTTHHNASLQVFARGDGGSRIVWTTDFLPDAVAPAIGALVDAGCAAMQRTLEGAANG